MIKFDANSIYDRLLQRMQQNPDWKVISNNSVVSSLLRSTSEVNAETARYAEYLFKESKWDTAQNPSSILAMARMLGYQPNRKISARGTIKVSADPRIHNIGSTLSSSLFDQESSNTVLQKYHWQKPPIGSLITITSNCSIKDSRGVNYVAIPKSFDTENSFATDIDIIQGIKKSIEINIDTIRDVATSSKLDPYLYIPVTIKNCENAGDAVSRAFFRVFLKYSRSNNSKIEYIEYRVTNTLLLSTSSDYDVEVYNDMYNQDLFYLKFNNDISRGNIIDISRNSNLLGIKIEYIESKGSKGNLVDLFDDFVLTNVTAESISDSTISYLKLFGTNYKPIIGGKDAEGIESIRENAPKYYMKNYTAGTKEAYENTIENLKFNIGNEPISPRKVRVYGGIKTQKIKDKEVSLPVTNVTFLADHMEDLIQSDLENPYKDIEESLNFYLYKLKSPQDTLKFVPPSYVPFALGISCKINREDNVDMASLVTEIRDLIDKEWGSNSNKLDFGRSLYPSNIEYYIHDNFPEVKAVNTEVEAISKASWMSAERILANSGIPSENKLNIPSSQTALEPGAKLHTIRVPFKFNSIFSNNNNSLSGFKMGKNGASYIMRIDILYKRPIRMAGTKEFHKTIFIEDYNSDNSEKIRKNNAFYIKATQQKYLWNENLFGSSDGAYSELDNLKVDKLSTSIQLPYKNHLYTDADYDQLKYQIDKGDISIINDYLSNPGALDDYLIYFAPSFSADSDVSSGGWIELSFESLHSLLSVFARYDNNLAANLAKAPLNELNCGETASKAFDEFKSILRDYVDIYVSMRPLNKELIIPTTNNIEDADSDNFEAVLYIDTADSSVRNTTKDGNQTINLSSSKLSRMISVDCTYIE